MPPSSEPTKEYCGVCDQTHEVTMTSFRVCQNLSPDEIEMGKKVAERLEARTSDAGVCWRCGAYGSPMDRGWDGFQCPDEEACEKRTEGHSQRMNEALPDPDPSRTPEQRRVCNSIRARDGLPPFADPCTTEAPTDPRSKAIEDCLAACLAIVHEVSLDASVDDEAAEIRRRILGRLRGDAPCPDYPRNDLSPAVINALVQKCRPTGGPEDGTLGTQVSMGFEAVQALVMRFAEGNEEFVPIEQWDAAEDRCDALAEEVAVLRAQLERVNSRLGRMREARPETARPDGLVGAAGTVLVAAAMYVDAIRGAAGTDEERVSLCRAVDAWRAVPTGGTETP